MISHHSAVISVRSSGWLLYPSGRDSTFNANRRYLRSKYFLSEPDLFLYINRPFDIVKYVSRLSLEGRILDYD